jgi:tetratricopeptide (TPR) repeat protein
MIGALARAYGAAGGYDREDALLTELLDQGDATADDRYDKVWFSLFYRPITGEDLALLEQMPPRDAQSMRTMAIALAEVDRPSDALRTLHRSMEVSQRDEPDPDDWYAFGRIYEQLGAKDAAEGAYGRMAAPSGDPPPEGSSQLLAARRLNALFGN